MPLEQQSVIATKVNNIFLINAREYHKVVPLFVRIAASIEGNLITSLAALEF